MRPAATEQLNSKGLGWKPELPSIHDHLWRRRVGQIKYPARASLRPKVNWIRNQGETGSCVGQSIAQAVDITRNGKVTHSARYAYYNARRIQGWEDIDDGAYIRDGMDQLAASGIAVESKFKFSERLINKAPTRSVDAAAERWKGERIRVESLDEVLQAIGQGHPVVLGFTCYSNMFTPETDQTGILPLTPGGRIVGGHAVCTAEYDVASRRLGFPNSWDEDWGAGGWGQMPFDWMVNWGQIVDDAWALVKEA